MCAGLVVTRLEAGKNCHLQFYLPTPPPKDLILELCAFLNLHQENKVILVLSLFLPSPQLSGK